MVGFQGRVPKIRSLGVGIRGVGIRGQGFGGGFQMPSDRTLKGLHYGEWVAIKSEGIGARALRRPRFQALPVMELQRAPQQDLGFES